MAHVEKRADRKYRARYRGPDGVERSQTFSTKHAAQKWADAQETAKATGEWVDPAAGRVTFQEYSEAWRATKVDVAARTLVNIEGRLDNHAVPFFGEMAMAAVRPLHVRAWVAGLRSRGLARQTVKASYLTVSQVFAAAVTDRVIARSPCVDVDFGKDREREEVAFLTGEQIASLADAITARYRCAVLFAAYQGLRAGELWALKARRVNELTRTVDVVESAFEIGGELREGPTKTGKVRTIGLPVFLSEEVKAHLSTYGTSEAGHLFTSAEGFPVRHHNLVKRHFHPACVDAGLATFEKDETTGTLRYVGPRFHDLRHTSAALLIAAGRHLEEVRDHLGHSTIRVTSDTYGHLFPRARQDVANALDETYAKTKRERLAASPRPEAQIRPLRNGTEAQ